MRIGLCGTMSVGKTTLVKELKQHSYFKNKKYEFFTERSKHLMNLGIPLNQKSTYEGQLVFFSERVSELTKENMITDRTVIDVNAFSQASKDISDEQKGMLYLIKNQLVKEYDIIFYVPIIDEIPMENNGIRETNEDYRKIIDYYIEKDFSNININSKSWYHYIQGKNIGDRVNEMIEVIKNHESSKKEITIINNVPCKYVEQFPTEIDFILLHKLIDNKRYRNYYLKNVDNGKYKILDNSAFELKEGLDRKLLLEWAQKINATEIIIPDVYGDKKRTIQLMKGFFEEYPNCGYKIMGVPQGENQKELIECMRYMVKHPKIDTIGINKLWDRKNLKNKTIKKPIHLLGLNNIKEWGYDYGNLNIRSADSRRLAQIILNKEDIWEEKMNKKQSKALKRLIEEIEKW